MGFRDNGQDRELLFAIPQGKKRHTHAGTDDYHQVHGNPRDLPFRGCRNLQRTSNSPTSNVIDSRPLYSGGTVGIMYCGPLGTTKGKGKCLSGLQDRHTG